MIASNKPRWFQFTLSLLGVGLLLAAQRAHAVQPPRWTLAADQQLAYEITNSTTLALDDGPAVYRLEQLLNVTWRVVEVDEVGTATIEQSVDRIRLELDDPLGQLRYDSDVDEEAGSLIALAGSVLTAMLEHPVRFMAAADGNVTGIEIPQPLTDAVADVSFARSLDQFASPEGLQRLLVPRLPRFPADQLEPGLQWSETIQSSNQLAGWKQVEIAYRYEGEKTQDGAELAVLVPILQVAFAKNEDLPLQVEKQESTGELLFNRTEGHLQSCHWQITIEVDAADNQRGRMEQSFRMEYQSSEQEPNEPSQN